MGNKNEMYKKIKQKIECNIILKPDKKTAQRELRELEKKLPELEKTVQELQEYRDYLKTKTGGHAFTSIKTMFFEDKMKGKVKEIKIDYSKKNGEVRKSRGCPGLKTIQMCKCGNYSPKSMKGLINHSCRNCGGRKPTIIYK